MMVDAKGIGTRRIIAQSLRLALVIAVFPCMLYRVQWPMYRRASEASEQERAGLRLYSYTVLTTALIYALIHSMQVMQQCKAC